MKYLLPLALLAFVAPFVHAEDLIKNGDFKAGSSHWSGAKVINVDEAGQVAADGFPVLELSATKNLFTESTQRVKIPNGKKRIEIIVVAKSVNFILNGDSQKFSDLDWENGGHYFWSNLVYPKFDFCIRFDGDGTHHYCPTTLRNGEWTTVRSKFLVEGRGQYSLSLLVAPGDGKILIRSVTVQEVQ